MKLQEALSERKSLTDRISRLEQRLKNAARSAEGEEPAEKVEDLRKALTKALEDLRVLIIRINLTNNQATVEGLGETIVQAIARRDVLKMELGILTGLVREVTEKNSLFGGRDRVKYVTHLDVKELQDELDSKSKRLRELDVKIQQANFNTDLIELEPQPAAA